jgi:hypothetical protein
MLLAHLWLNNVTSTLAMGITGFSQHTITRFFACFWQLVSSTLGTEDTIIGGPGIIVEVDETKLEKRKYHRDHRVEGVWVVVGVERTESQRAFVVPVENRSRETLTALVHSHVANGSIVHTDCWGGYSGLGDVFEIEHRTVNHSQFFVDPATNVRTNTVEGTNFALKRAIPIRCRVRNGIEGHLAEFVWRRMHTNVLWASFVSALKDIHYEFE